MKLTENRVKEIIVQVHNDLKLAHSDKYPIFCTPHKADEKHNDWGIANWGGGYDYRDPEAVGDLWIGAYPEYLVTIDDKKGEAIAYHYYTGHFLIRLNEDGKYEVVKQLYRPS